MTIHELINMSSQKVRENSDLMAFYVDEFKKQFGSKPNCAGCTFSADFIKLKKAVESGNKPLNKIQMKTEASFQLYKRKGEILSYQKNKRTIRAYDNKMNEDFAVGYLTHGTKEELSERKKLFKILPEVIRLKDERNGKTLVSPPVIEEIKTTKENPAKKSTKKSKAKSK